MTIVNSDTIKVNLRGVRVGGEEWNTGFWLLVGPNGTVTQTILDSLRAQIAGAATTWWTSAIQAQCSSATDFNTVQLLHYPASSPTATLLSEEDVVVAPGTGTNPHPYEVSAVVSLRTAIPTRSGRGRMYLPTNAITLDATQNQFLNEDIVAIADATDVFLTAVNGFTAGFQVTVAVAVASHTQQQARPVQQIVVDTLPDIQRRRGNSLSPLNVQTRALA